MTEVLMEWRAFVERYADDPAGFAEHVIGMKPLEWQREVMDAIAAGERRLSIRSGHGVGKSSCAAALVLWYLTTRYPCKILVTAPTASQLYDALFAEIKSRLRRMPAAISDLFEATSDRVVLAAGPTEAFCSARTSSKERPESLAGVHSENVLLIADEASGIPEEVFESAAGSMSGASATTLLLGNPLRSSGFFWRTQTELADEWWTRTVSCLDSPLVSADFISDMASRYGDESNAWRCRVLGEFPEADDDTYIPLHLIEAATHRDIKQSPSAAVVWGVDCARYGSDRSALAKRRGAELVEVKTWRDKSTMELAGIILDEYENTPITDRPQEICVDVIGIGAGVLDRLIELDTPARGINVAESAAMNQKYMRLRDELWGKAREWFETRESKIPGGDAQLVHELAAPRFAFTSTGKIKIESKDDMKKRGIRSPDIADAVCLTFASNAIIGAHGSRYAWKQVIETDTSWVV